MLPSISPTFLTSAADRSGAWIRKKSKKATSSQVITFLQLMVTAVPTGGDAGRRCIADGTSQAFLFLLGQLTPVIA